MIFTKKLLKLIAVGLIIGTFCVTFFLIFRYQNTSDERSKDEYLTSIKQLQSSIDMDKDGIDDQLDILQGALNYISQKPKYKSRYYNGGYPDDGYGVCTDVVANALKEAGYDLMNLVDEDIRLNPEDYDITEPDKNIDFRRVKNLRVYLSNTAISLSKDLSDIEAWQGGDIVVFTNHIGVVSDRRNENGIPYVIHHNDPWQTDYEQDILENYDDIVGHYRISE